LKLRDKSISRFSFPDDITLPAVEIGITLQYQ